MRRLVVTCLVAAPLALSATALVPRTAWAAPTPHEQALDLFDKGRAAYREGRFPDAVDLLSRAYAIEREPVLLYNLARAYEGLGDFERAVQTYEQYLREGKEIPDRAAIEQRVANLKKSVEEKQRLAKERDDALKAQADRNKAASDEARTTAPPPSAKRSPSPVPWIIAGVGVLGLGAGAGLGAVALSKNGDAERPTTSQKDAVAMHDSAKGLALGSTISLVAGGILTAGGTTWGIIDLATRGSGPAKDQKHAIKVTFGPTGAGLRVGF